MKIIMRLFILIAIIIVAINVLPELLEKLLTTEQLAKFLNFIFKSIKKA